MPISWNTHTHNINKMTLIFFCFDNELIKKNVQKKKMAFVPSFQIIFQEH